MNTPLVSIIIPSFNRASIINDTIDSILGQTYSNWECLVVDDGSTDETKKVINNYALKDARIIALERPQEKNKGANSCRNYGLSVAKGDYIVFFDSDDIMATTCIENRINTFIKYPEKDMLIFSMGIFKENKKLEVHPNRKVVNLNLKETIEDFVLGDKLPWNVCRPIFKSEFLKVKIEFNERIQRFQDGEFNIRVLYFLKPDYLSIDITDCYYRFDDVSVNKYMTKRGIQNIVDCFYEYYLTVFFVFSDNQKQKYRKEIILKFFNYLTYYVKPKINIKKVLKTVSLFNKELNLTKRELISIYVVIYLNKFYHERKGHYYLSSKLKKIISK